MQLTKRVIVKFDGAELRCGESFRKAAEMIKESDFKEIAVVVSAMEKTTDNLIDCMKSIGEVDDADYADIVSTGERISARIFCLALKALGIKSIYFDPQREDWPIITDSNFREAEPNLEETIKRVKTHIEPLLGEYVPVICGFIGKDREGRVTTLGRGGSDITATLLGNCLKADEVIFVKNTEGVSFIDPEIVPNARPLRKILVEEMFSLAHRGAKIVHPKALRYKLPEQRLRVVSFYKSLSSEGTEIIGAFSNPFEVKSYNRLCALTLVGEINAANLEKIFSILAGERIIGISTGKSSITIFVEMDDKKALLSKLCLLEGFKGVSLKENVSALEIINPDFIESPEWIAKISSALAEKGINILEISSSKATITIFLDEDYLDKALEAVEAINSEGRLE
ncbi:MAG TPA: aspartate kinase [Candidatus Bathyarchaeota archaeon]|nr:aspartate kinase [Candidatus Bathyarchaeota archaeon]